MLIKGSKSKIYIKGRSSDDIPLFFIHGFTGSSDTWNSIRDLINKQSYAIDIPGHNKSIFNNLKENYNIEDFCVEFYLLLNSLNINKIDLCGYSMGGRLSLAFAYKYPDKINSLILESTSFGIENFELKDERLLKDLELCIKIKDDYDNFIVDWSENKIFKNQKLRNKNDWDSQNNIRSNHNKYQLAKSLESFSVGRMNYLENELNLFDFPVYLISGENDEKFFKISHKLMKLNSNVTHYRVNSCGHNTHLEDPKLFTDIINNIY